jgi:hypothetical protein
MDEERYSHVWDKLINNITVFKCSPMVLFCPYWMAAHAVSWITFTIDIKFPSTAWSCCSSDSYCVCTGNCDLRQCHSPRWQTRHDMFSIIQDRKKSRHESTDYSHINVAFITGNRNILRCRWNRNCRKVNATKGVSTDCTAVLVPEQRKD